MANKAYLDMAGLTQYDELIKGVIGTEAEAAETNAKNYADGLKSTIDGEIDGVEAAATALTTRVQNLETTVNTDHETRLDTLEGAATLEGSVKYQVKQASDAINATIGTVEEGKTVVEMIADAKTAATYDDTQVKADITANAKAISDEVTRAKAAEQANATAISDETKRAQEVEAGLDAYMGEIPEDAISTNLVDYISEVVEENAYDDTQVKADIKANTDAIAVLNGSDTTEGSVAKAVSDAKTEINNKIGTVTEGKTLVQMISDAQTAATYDDTQVKADIKANADAIDALEGVVGDVEALKTTEKATVVGAINEVFDGVAAHKTAIDETVATLVGEDVNKSVREIANEELAAQLIGENAKESLDTLEEIAAWIQSHPDDASAMNKAIEDLEKLVGTLPEGATATTVVGYVDEAIAALKIGDYAKAADLTAAVGRIAQNETDIATLKTAVGEGGSVDSKITTAIEALDADVTSAAVEAGKGVQVQVVEVDGKVTTVNVTGNYDNAYDVKGAAAQALTDAKGYADGLAGNYDAAGSAAQALTDSKSYTDTEIAKFVAISEDEISSLFA